MGKVLRLNIAGLPTSWITREDAAILYSRNMVSWEAGAKLPALLGGSNSKNGRQSSIDIRAIVATKGKASHCISQSSFTNRMLFKRDNFRCMYCGLKLNAAELTRDHIFPSSRGGLDTWENTVASCKGCNQYKADRTPEEAGMALLAIPFRPNVFEAMYLAQHAVLADQMAYLEKRFSGKRIWCAA